ARGGVWSLKSKVPKAMRSAQAWERRHPCRRVAFSEELNCVIPALSRSVGQTENFQPAQEQVAILPLLCRGAGGQGRREKAGRRKRNRIASAGGKDFRSSGI